MTEREEALQEVAIRLTQAEAQYVCTIMGNIADTTDDESVRRDSLAVRGKIIKVRALRSAQSPHSDPAWLQDSAATLPHPEEKPNG